MLRRASLLLLVPVLAAAPAAVSGGSGAGRGGVSGGGERAGSPAPGAQWPGPPEDSLRAAFLRLWARSYFPGRSGDVMVVPRERHFVTIPAVPFLHGSPWDYDVRIPLVFYGEGWIRPGVYEEEASHEDVGATLERLLNLPRRRTTTGRPLAGLLERGRGAEAAPAVVAVLVLDGFRADYLDRYREVLPVLSRLAEEGAFFPRARVDVLPTATAVSHTTLATGSVPGVHGITGNNLYARAEGRAHSAYSGMTATRSWVPTLAERWAWATNGRARIVGQGGNYYPAAALVGRGGCGFGGWAPIAYYFDAGEGRWKTNPDCYELPSYLENRRILDLVSSAEAGGASVTPRQARTMPGILPVFEAEALLEVLRREPIGEDGVTDLILANLKAVDYVGHRFGPDSEEMRETLRSVDRELARFVQGMGARAGEAGFVLVVTADHGMPGEPPEGGRRGYAELLGPLNRRFDPEGPGIVRYFDGADNQLYLDRDRLRALGVSVPEVARWVETLPFIFAAFPEEEVRRAADALWDGR